jgi:hypothetical protein
VRSFLQSGDLKWRTDSWSPKDADFVPRPTSLALQNFETVLTQSVEESSYHIPMRRIVATAGQFRLTAYDAECLDTARLQNFPARAP